MNERSCKLDTARRESVKSVRRLERDRVNLKKQESKLQSILKVQMTAGDITKSKMVLNQIAYLQNIGDRNFQRGLFIQNEMFIRRSNHAVNQAHVEFLKGLRFTNGGNNLDTIRKREKKYHRLQDVQDAMENLLNEGFEGFFEEFIEERPTPNNFEEQVAAILKQAIDPGIKATVIDKNDHLAKYFDGHIRLQLKVYGCNEISAAITVPTSEISVDMLRRCIFRDKNVVKILNLGKSNNNIQLGQVCQEDGEQIFKVYSSTESLEKIGLIEDDVVWIYINE